MTRRALILVLLAVVVLALLIACSSGGTAKGTVNPATVTVTVSDPATCSSASAGSYSNVWVTITDVQIHTSATAPDNDPNWVDLTPNLKNTPQQVDLLAAATNQCFLATLGTTTSLQPGTYQQIRMILADNANNVTNNHCGAAGVNCVVLAPPSTQVPQTLQLSSESRTGIKIPSGQLAGGKFTVASGDTKDLNIDFNTCASIVMQSNGQFRLKPVLHAGEVSLTPANNQFINGRLIDKATGQPIVGGIAIVALEQKDTNGVERVMMQTTPANNGAFNFCPVAAGTYEVVAMAVSRANVAYAATITTGVQPGNALGDVPMIAVTGASTSPAILTGDVTTVNGSNNATAADIQVSALQDVTIAGTPVKFTIPAAAQSATIGLTTPCISTPCYTLTLPPVNPTVGAFLSTGTTYTAGAAGSPSYTIEGQAFVPQSGPPDCTQPIKTIGPITVVPGSNPPLTTMAFIGCQ